MEQNSPTQLSKRAEADLILAVYAAFKEGMVQRGKAAQLAEAHEEHTADEDHPEYDPDDIIVAEEFRETENDWKIFLGGMLTLSSLFNTGLQAELEEYLVAIHKDGTVPEEPRMVTLAREYCLHLLRSN